METVKPITPKNALHRKSNSIPAFVINIVNELIVKNINSDRRAIIKKKDIIQELLNHDAALHENEVYKKGWLDFEPIFEAAGWKVTYDSPSYGESEYDSTFEFKPKK